MRAHDLKHLSDAALLRDLAGLVVRDRVITAALLAHIAEVDARGLYRSAGYSSMYAYCVEELRLSEDAAYKRIQAARAGRKFPALLVALAEGRLHLTGLGLLVPHLTPENADELLAAASDQRKSAIEGMLGRRYPRMEVAAYARTLQPMPAALVPQLAPSQVARPSARPAPDGERAPAQVEVASGGELAPAQVEEPADGELAPAQVEMPALFLLQITIGQGAQEKLRYAQDLLSHSIPSRDVALVLERALEALIEQCEKRKFAVTPHPQAPRRSGVGKRHVPAHVRRAVWERDRGRCTFVGGTGNRCSTRSFLELDHIDPVARGGLATEDRMRLRCRAHNQYEAERVLGAQFMERKRLEARRRVSPRDEPAHVPETGEVGAEEVGAWAVPNGPSGAGLAGLPGPSQPGQPSQPRPPVPE